jgi:D-alanine transaminase
VTPRQSSHLLSGTTRPIVARLALSHGIAVTEDTLSRDRLLAADEVFVTSTTFGVMPVVRIDDQAIGTEQAGPIAIALAAGLRAELGL